jgi:hypothetical protein
MDSFASELGVSFAPPYEGPHVVPRERVCQPPACSHRCVRCVSLPQRIAELSALVCSRKALGFSVTRRCSASRVTKRVACLRDRSRQTRAACRAGAAHVHPEQPWRRGAQGDVQALERAPLPGRRRRGAGRPRGHRAGRPARVHAELRHDAQTDPALAGHECAPRPPPLRLWQCCAWVHVCVDVPSSSATHRLVCAVGIPSPALLGCYWITLLAPLEPVASHADLWSRLEALKPAWQEPQGERDGPLEPQIEGYYGAIAAGRGGIFFAVCRGKARPRALSRRSLTPCFACACAARHVHRARICNHCLKRCRVVRATVMRCQRDNLTVATGFGGYQLCGRPRTGCRLHRHPVPRFQGREGGAQEEVQRRAAQPAARHHQRRRVVQPTGLSRDEPGATLL